MNEKRSNLSVVAIAFLVQSLKMNYTPTAKWSTAGKGAGPDYVVLSFLEGSVSRNLSV